MASPIPVGTTVDLRLLDAALRRRAERARDLRPWYRGRVAPDMTSLLLEQFASSGSRLRRGARWARLTPSTLAKKRAKGTDQLGILRDSLEMMNAFVNPRHPQAVEIIQKLRYIRSVQGRAKEIAGYHKTGTRHMVARPVMGFGAPAPVRRAWAGSLTRYLATGVVS